MQPATGKQLFRQDVPILLLAWLVPAALLLLSAGQQAWPGNLLAAESLAEFSSVRGVFSGNSPVQAIVSYVWPLLLLFALIVGVASSSLQMIGKRGMLVSLTYCAVSLTVLAHFAPGNVVLSALQLVLLIGLLAFCLSSRHAPQLAIGAGLCAAAMLATGLEAVPFVVVATSWIAAEWALNGGEHGDNTSRKTLYFGYSFASGTLILGLFAGPGWSIASNGCGLLSLAHLLPATMVGLGLVHLATSTAEFSGLKQRLICIGFLAIIACGGMVAANPSCVLLPSIGLINGAAWPWGQGFEFGLFALFAQDPLTAYILTATPLIGLGAACSASVLSRQQRLAWALLLGCLFVAVALMILDTRFAIFANALAIIPCAFLTLLVGQYSQSRRPTPLAGAAFIMVWLSGMNLTHSLIGTHVVPNTVTQQSQATQNSSTPNNSSGVSIAAGSPCAKGNHPCQ